MKNLKGIHNTKLTTKIFNQLNEKFPNVFSDVSYGNDLVDSLHADELDAEFGVYIYLPNTEGKTNMDEELFGTFNVMVGEYADEKEEYNFETIEEVIAFFEAKLNPKTLEQFIAAGVEMSIEQFEAADDNNYFYEEKEAVEKLIVYNGMYIIKVENGLFRDIFAVSFDRSDCETDTIEQAAEFLWNQFAKFELLTIDEIETDLHGQAEKLIIETGNDCSLDEICPETLSEEDKEKQQHVLNLFVQFEDIVRIKRSNAKNPCNLTGEKI